jgi:hypothetical protein
VSETDKLLPINEEKLFEGFLKVISRVAASKLPIPPSFLNL